MRRAVAGLVLAASLLAAGPARAETRPVVTHHEGRDRYGDGDCYDDYDCGGGDDYGDGSNGNSGGRYEGGRSGDQGDGDGQCRNFCNITVPTPPMIGQQPKGFIPPNPGKIPQQIADFIKVVSDFVQAVIKFAV